MPMTHPKCASCGAALDWPEGQRRAKCKYCGTRVRLASPGAPSQLVVDRTVKAFFVFFGVIVTIIIAANIRMFWPDTPPEMRISNVKARWVPSSADGKSLDVRASVEVIEDMPHVAPHVVVSADCGSHADESNLLFMGLSNLKEGATRTGRVRLFHVPIRPVRTPDCELTLRPSAGEGAAATVCFSGERVSAGPCAEL